MKTYSTKIFLSCALVVAFVFLLIPDSVSAQQTYYIGAKCDVSNPSTCQTGKCGKSRFGNSVCIDCESSADCGGWACSPEGVCLNPAGNSEGDVCDQNQDCASKKCAAIHQCVAASAASTICAPDKHAECNNLTPPLQCKNDACVECLTDIDCANSNVVGPVCNLNSNLCEQSDSGGPPSAPIVPGGGMTSGSTPSTKSGSYFPLVQCGLSAAASKDHPEYQQPCNICDIFKLAKNLIDFILYAGVPLLATIAIVYAGLLMVLGGYNSALFGQGQKLLTQILIGLLLVFSAWLLTNTLIKFLAKPGAFENVRDKWFEFTCKSTTTPTGLISTGGGTPTTKKANGDVCANSTECQSGNCDQTKTPKICAAAVTSAGNGSFPLFKQEDAPWGSQSYTNGQCGSPSTVGSSGCGPSAMAMVVKFYQNQGKASGGSVDPGIVANLSLQGGFRACSNGVGQGTSYGMFPYVAAKYGLTAQNNVSWSAAQAAISKGIPVIAAVGPGYFTKGGHFIVLYGIDSSSNILVSDSGPRNRTSAPASIVQSQQHFLTIITPK